MQFIQLVASGLVLEIPAGNTTLDDLDAPDVVATNAIHAAERRLQS